MWKKQIFLRPIQLSLRYNFAILISNYNNSFMPTDCLSSKIKGCKIVVNKAETEKILIAIQKIMIEIKIAADYKFWASICVKTDVIGAHYMWIVYFYECFTLFETVLMWILSVFVRKRRLDFWRVYWEFRDILMLKFLCWI